MNQEPPKNVEEVIEKQRIIIAEKQKQEGIRQMAIFVFYAFIAYLLMNFNTSWLFGITFPPLYATLLSFIFVRISIPLAVLGYCLQQIGVSFPILPLTIS